MIAVHSALNDTASKGHLRNAPFLALLADALPLVEARQFRLAATLSVTQPLLFGHFLEWSGYWSSFYMYMGVLPFIVFIFIFKIGRGVPVNDYGKELSGLKFSKRFRYGAVFSFYVASEIIISSRLVYYLMEAKGYSSEAAREGLSLFFLSLMLGRLTFSFLPIRGKSYHAMVTSLLLSLSLFMLKGNQWLQHF